MGQYHVGMEEFPFYQGERQSPAYMIPALSSVADGVAGIEAHVSRKRKVGGSSRDEIWDNKKDANGYLDYWANFRDTVFAIEVKHAFFSILNNKPEQEIQISSKISDRWDNSREQLKNLRKDEFVEDSEALVSLSFLILPFFKTTTNSGCGSDCDWNEAALKFFAEQFHSTLKDGPNLFAFWKLKKAHREVKFENDRKESYPIVAFIARAESM